MSTRDQSREGGEVVQLETNQNVLADLTEALIGAVYLAFGFETVRPAVVDAFNEHIKYAVNSYVDYKTELQEHLARDGRIVKYEVLASKGPAHEREFEIEARIGEETLGRGVGTSKKRAEQEAAREALGALQATQRRLARASRARVGRSPCARGELSVYLKGLRLKGFKSFPGQTSLVFEPGVGVIIGPNGSGKSNLADAVIWALGEQSPTSLRGTSMQDLIFAGSDGRRALASAEVELTFDNADGSLPLPTAEVSVMRRVTRDGSSQYFINRSACRLTDVVELLAPVGLGKELHSIIGQGKVEAFLAGKPEDRRSQIEEAAGLGAFKRRRERAEVKLREVGRNLERAALLERQVDAQLGPIRRQATAAEQLHSIEADLGETRGRLLTGAVAALDAELLVLRRDLAEIAVARTRGDEGLARVAEARAGEEEAFARRLAERERRAQRLLRARMLDTRLETGERLTEQRLRLHHRDGASRRGGAPTAAPRTRGAA